VGSHARGEGSAEEEEEEASKQRIGLGSLLVTMKWQ
jgi:hypothetical protein